MPAVHRSPEPAPRRADCHVAALTSGIWAAGPERSHWRSKRPLRRCPERPCQHVQPRRSAWWRPRQTSIARAPSWRWRQLRPPAQDPGSRGSLPAARCRSAMQFQSRGTCTNSASSARIPCARPSSSMAEQWTFNPMVQGSSPWGATAGKHVSSGRWRTPPGIVPRVSSMARGCSGQAGSQDGYPLRPFCRFSTFRGFGGFAAFFDG